MKTPPKRPSPGTPEDDLRVKNLVESACDSIYWTLIARAHQEPLKDQKS